MRGFWGNQDGGYTGVNFIIINQTAHLFILFSVCGLYPTIKSLLKNIASWGFPGGTVVKNLPANAGDTGSSPGPGRSNMLRSN